MFGQQTVCILGIIILFLAGIAVFCATIAEDQPEYYSLVYIAISIFIFYMGTIMVIIILQIIETCQEQHQQNQLSLDIQRPISTTQISPQSNYLINDEKIIIPTESNIRLSRSHTLPLTSSLYSSHHTPSSDSKDFKITSSEIIETATCVALLPKHPQTFTTIHKNYQSFAFVTNDLHHPS